jgi:ribosomal protein S16
VIMTTTAARSRDFMRKQGYIAECTEHRRGKFIRVDLFGYADVLAYNGKEIVAVQAYHKKEEHKHASLTANDPRIEKWLQSGGRMEHHLWQFTTKHKRKHWTVTRRLILLNF